ncbi:MAG TPA: molybdopterin dinucleotide binding domain-containing protein, partial [Burkholderiaceae bacterium]
EQGWQDLPLSDAPFAEGGFATANGKAQAAGADYQPNYESRLSSPELAKRFPLAMISPPARNFLNSSFVNVKSLRDIEGEPIVEMHADDAAARGLADGARVAVFNERGRYVSTLRISPRARPGVVNGLGVWWRKLGLEGSNVNEVTHQRLTDLGNAPSFYDCLVEVSAA